MFIPGKSYICAVLLGFMGCASAANIYKPGTNPDLMYKVVKPVVGDAVTPIFLFGNDPDELLKALDPLAVKEAAIESPTFDYFVARVRPESQAYGINGYAMGGSGVPGNEDQNRTCAIVMASDKQIMTTSIMFHESVHCRSFSDLRRDPESWKLAVSMNRPTLGMSNNQFMSLFHEVLAAYIQVAFDANQGVKDGIGMVIGAAKPDKNTATSIGFRTARNALKMCRTKDSCSTYAPDVVRMLKSNTYARAQMMLDLKELFDAAKASGYVVENH